MNRDGFTKELVISEDLTVYHQSDEPMDKWLNEMTNYADHMNLSIKLNIDDRGFMRELEDQVRNADYHTKSDFFESSLREDWIHPTQRMSSGAGALDDEEEIEDLTAKEIEQLRKEALSRKQESEVIKFSDVPPALKQLIYDLIQKVEDKIGEEDSEVISAGLKGFIEGRYNYTQAEVSSQMAKHLRMLI
jgi:hypothetical protein